MHKQGSRGLRLVAVAASLANGSWVSLSQGPERVHVSAVLAAIAAVWAGYFRLAWLFRGMRS
jgi:hypothetical protein